MIARLVRELLVGVVWAGALTALVLGATVVGLLLVAAGLLQLVQLRTGRSDALFGAGSKPSNTTARGL